jgi:hypothetical protein
LKLLTNFSFFRVHFTKKSLPQLVKYCTDVDCSGNDGIAPKNICQSCLELLKIVFEFKSKSQESDRYLKQIISHSTAREAPLIPATITNEVFEGTNPEDDLLEMIDDVEDDDFSTKKGHRSGDYECTICNKFFKYIKPFKNHMKTHNAKAIINKTKEKLSYYKRKKLRDALENSLIKKITPVPRKIAKKSSSLKYADSSPEPEPQAEYDSISPYQNSPAYEDESVLPRDNCDDMDFGALMLSTSQMIGKEVEKDNPEPRKSRTGRILKRSIIEADDDDVEISKSNGQKRHKPQTSSASSKASTRKPGPLSSKTRSKPAKQSESEEITIEGFSEVDISKMLKKSSDSATRLGKNIFF